MANKSDINRSAGGDSSDTGDIVGTKPVTDYGSKMVMLRGERGDKVVINQIVTSFQNTESVPQNFEIVQRLGTFYGTELQLRSTIDEDQSAYMLTAPGPDTFLYLWASEKDSDGFRIGWSKLAELKMSFEDDLPQYPICSDCGEPIKTLEHERLSITGKCDSLVD